MVKGPVLFEEGEFGTHSAFGEFGFLHADDVCLERVEQLLQGLPSASEEVQQAVHVPCHYVHFIANRYYGASCSIANARGVVGIGLKALKALLPH